MARKSPLDIFLTRVIKKGNLEVAFAGGLRLRYGDGSGPDIAIRLTDRRQEWLLAADPRLRLGEAYMDGTLILERGNLYDLVSLFVCNAKIVRLPLWVRLLDHVRFHLRRWRQFNPIFRARRNVARHYDIKSEIYDLFLDADKQYSCAYFEHEAMPLEQAQLLKKRRLAAKLALKDGARVLDIGSGWGGLAIYLADIGRADVTGVTLSTEQFRIARERVRKLGLDRRVNFQLQDYRKLQGSFDRIISVGMFEHVGVSHYHQYFRKLSRLLKDDGVALVHTIGRSGPPGATNPFIAKYIFPGGYIPALSEILPAVERAGLLVTDIEVLRLHYAETLKHWRHRFLANWNKAAGLMGERFCRMWEFYLAGSEAAFRHENLVVFQIQLTKSPDVLPVTRTYIAEQTARLAHLEQSNRIRSA